MSGTDRLRRRRQPEGVQPRCVSDSDDDEEETNGLFGKNKAFKDECERLSDQIAEPPVEVGVGFSLKSEDRDFSETLGRFESVGAARQLLVDYRTATKTCASRSSRVDDVDLEGTQELVELAYSKLR